MYEAVGLGGLVVMAHGFSATITMTADRYASTFAAAGLGVLLYDHRNFGGSDGEPRREVNAWLQARGFRDAIGFAATLPGVDAERIGLWGDSFSAAVALVVAGVDPRVAAVVAQVPATGRELPPADPDGQLYQALRETLLTGDIIGGPDETVGRSRRSTEVTSACSTTRAAGSTRRARGSERSSSGRSGRAFA